MDPSVRSTVDPATVARAKASYKRCLAAGDFIGEFYRRFFAACPEAREKFSRTDFERQHRLLRHAIGLLLTYPGHAGGDPGLLTRIADRHSQRDLDAHPSLYPVFVDSLVDTIASYDPAFTPQVAGAWRATLQPGVAYMQSRY